VEPSQLGPLTEHLALDLAEGGQVVSRLEASATVRLDGVEGARDGIAVQGAVGWCRGHEFCSLSISMTGRVNRNVTRLPGFASATGFPP
jgi:hypothetical protein